MSFKMWTQIFLSKETIIFWIQLILHRFAGDVSVWNISMTWALPVFIEIQSEACNNHGYKRHKDGCRHWTAVGSEVVAWVVSGGI